MFPCSDGGNHNLTGCWETLPSCHSEEPKATKNLTTPRTLIPRIPEFRNSEFGEFDSSGIAEFTLKMGQVQGR